MPERAREWGSAGFGLCASTLCADRVQTTAGVSAKGYLLEMKTGELLVDCVRANDFFLVLFYFCKV